MATVSQPEPHTTPATRDNSRNRKPVLGLVLAAFATFFISFTTSGWTGNSGIIITFKDKGKLEANQGLWETCVPYSSGEAHHVVSQVFMCLALIAVIADLVLSILYVFVSRFNEKLLRGVIASSFLAFVLLLISVISYGSEVGSNVSWSYVIAVISTLLCFAAAVFSLVMMIRR